MGFYIRGRIRLGIFRRVIIIVSFFVLFERRVFVARGDLAGLGWLLRVLILWLG